MTLLDPHQEPRRSAMEFRTRSIAQVLDDLVAKLEQISPRHPDRPRLIRMVIDLRREIDRRLSPAPAGDC
jgi:hypothetical protein